MRASFEHFNKLVECAQIARECNDSLMKAFAANVKAQSDYVAILAQYRSAIESEQSRWNDAMIHVERAHDERASEVVTLDVGGVIFKTRVDTLSKHDLSYFGVYTSGRWNLAETAFIDRDPELFRYVMAYLRHDTLQLCDIGPALREALAKEADYYVLPELRALLFPAKVTSKVDWTIVDPDRTHNDIQRVTHTNNPTHLQCALGSSGWDAGVHEWNVTGDQLLSNNIIGVFFTSAAIEHTKSISSRSANTEHVLGVCTDMGMSWSSANKSIYVFGKEYGAKKNDVYSVRLDLNRKTLTFGLNGVWNKMPTYALDCFVKAGVVWYPYFEVYAKGASLWLVE